MKHKILTLAIMTSSLLTMSSCLDMTPVSSITDENMWTNEGQFTSFVNGVHSMLRDKDSQNLFILGELRSDIYSASSSGWTTESNKAEEITANLLSEQRPGLTNYANLYTNINQINLFIKKTNETSLLSPEDKAYYLGTMYGLRAFYYFHLLRSWGSVVWQEEPSMGFEIDNLSKPVTSEAEIMQNIKKDITSSENSFADDYSFRSNRSIWSKPATLILKAEVYLWSSRQMNGGEADAQTALNALNELQSKTSEIGLETNFADVFDYENKANKEIIFTLHNDYKESLLFNGGWRNNMVPQQNTLNSFYASATGERFNLNFNGNVYYPLNVDIYHNVFNDDLDTRKEATLKAAYEKQENQYVYKGCFAYKLKGMTVEGDSYRTFADDYPIYRYADVLLLKAEAKALTGGDPSSEINDIRQRADGNNYNAQTMAYGNMPGDSEGINEVLLRERLKEFMFEGKRWYDLRRFGKDYVMKYSSLKNEKHLLWPLDKDTMTDNPALEQTPGY